MLNVIWAMSSVQKPMVRWVGSRNSPNVLNQEAKLPQPLKNATNSRHMETPVTISAFIMGMLLTVISGFRTRRRMA